MASKNNAPFISCISKINDTLIDNAEDLDIVMPMYKLTEYSKNHSKATGSLWDYYRDEPNKSTVGNINYSIRDSKPFDYKTSIVGRLEGNNKEKEIGIVLPLKHLSNFQRTLDIPLINCEINFILTWFKNCVVTSKSTRDTDPHAAPAVAAINCPTNAAFERADTKVYAPAVILSTKDDKKL